MEYSGGYQTIEQTNDGVVDIPERADADLHQQEDCDGHQACQQRSSPDRNDLMSQRVRKLGIDNLAVLKEYRKGARRCRVRFIDAEANDAHDDHCCDVQPSHLEPLSERRASVPCLAVGVVSRARSVAILDAVAGAAFLTPCPSCGGSVRTSRRSASVEEAHCRFREL